MPRAKHRNDGNHGKSGWVSGNPRYRGSCNAGISRKSFRVADRREAAELAREALAERAAK